MRHRFAADTGDVAVFLGAEPGEEMPHQMRDVLPAHPQGWNRQRQHVKPIEQVFAELSAFDPVEQFAVGCGHDPHIDPDRFARADRLYGAFLQGAQQFDLGLEWKLRDFVEKQRAAGGFKEFSGVAFGRAGESSLFVAE